MIPPDGVWRVWVTDDDLRGARTAWAQARDDGAPVDRVLDLLLELERMTRTAALQASGDPWCPSHEIGAVRGAGRERPARSAAVAHRSGLSVGLCGGQRVVRATGRAKVTNRTRRSRGLRWETRRQECLPRQPFEKGACS